LRHKAAFIRHPGNRGSARGVDMKCEYCGNPNGTDCGNLIFVCAECTKIVPKPNPPPEKFSPEDLILRLSECILVHAKRITEMENRIAALELHNMRFK